MYGFYRKSPLGFSLIWIGIYCLVQSAANGISHKIGIDQCANAIFTFLMSIVLLWWLRKHGLLTAFRLNKPTQPPGKMIYYAPLILVSSSNLWLGARMNLPPETLAFHILLMVSVGFLEEVIFRGFLFEALGKDNLKSAVVLSSLTFGAGHIVNLFNGSGMTFMEVLFQIAFAVLMGLLFVMVELHSGSLIPCIASHVTINILSAFANFEASGNHRLTVQLIEMALVLLYLLILGKTAPLQIIKEPEEREEPFEKDRK